MARLWSGAEKFTRQVGRGSGQANGRRMLPKKEEDTMNRNAKNLAKGAALGMMAGAAAGAAGMYVAEQNPKQLKKAVKKAAHTAEKAVMGVEKLMQNM